MVDSISGGARADAVRAPEQEKSDKAQKSPSSEMLKGRSVQKETIAPSRNASSQRAPTAGRAEGKSWKERTARLDGVSRKSSSRAAHAKPSTPAPYKGLGGPATLQRASQTSPQHSNFNDVRRSKFQQQFQQRTQDYDKESPKLNAQQAKMYSAAKSEVASLLKHAPAASGPANEQFRQLTDQARAIENLFGGDDSYLADLTIGNWD